MKTAQMLAIVLLSGLMPVVGICASSQKETAADTEEAIRQGGIGGLIVDDTVTFIGRQFYHAFALEWLSQGVTGERNLSVREQPTAQSGSRVWVEHNRQTLFQVFLSPTLANIEITARQAAALVAQRFKTMEIERILLKNPDLAPDEF